MLPIWKTTKQTLNRTGAGLIDPDTERHHPELGTARPHSPTNAYLPGANSDAGTEALHRDLVNHRFETLEPHPAMPAGPAGEMLLGRAHGDAMLAFREQVLSRPFGGDYAQSYRVEGGRFVPVHPDLIPGNAGDVLMPSGSYPAGTGLVIHSRPVNGPGFPNEADLLRAYHDRTNALQQPGSSVAMHMLYNPANDRVFMYDGSLDAHGNPHFFQAIVPPPGQLAQHPAVPYVQPAPLIAQPPVAHYYARPFQPMPEPAPRPAPLPMAQQILQPPAFFHRDPSPGSAARPIEVSDSPSPKPVRSPSPDWDNMIDFNP